MVKYRTFGGKRYELFEDRVSKESAMIVAKRFKRNGAKVRITKHKPSRSYQLWARGKGEFWMY